MNRPEESKGNSIVRRCDVCGVINADSVDPWNRCDCIAASVARNPQLGDTVRGRTVTRRSDLWVEYQKGLMKYMVRLETWTRCVCRQMA